MSALFKYIKRFGVGLTQLGSSVLFGNPDISISGYVGYKSFTTNGKRWKIAEKVINTLFFFHPNHCFESIEWDELNDSLENYQ